MSASPSASTMKDFFHIRRIAQADTLPCKTIINFVFDLVDDDHTVSRYPAFDLQKEILADVFLRKPADLLLVVWESLLKH